MATGRCILHLIAISHFTAMFVAFSIPPFLGTILASSFDNGSAFLGLCYAAPAITAFAAYHARTKLADYLGERNTAITSYLCISVIMFITGLASTPEQFLIGLILQGVVAPTFATSSSYLACWIRGDKLVTGISSLQIITRIAAASGPSILGIILIDMSSPIHIYRFLAAITFCTALLLIFFLPKSARRSDKPNADSSLQRMSPSIVWKPYLTQIILLFSITASAPHFINYVQIYLKTVPDHLFGVMFALPSIAYLCCVPFMSAIKRINEFNILFIGFTLVTLGFGGQWLAQSWLMVAFCQITIGIGTFIAFTAINIFLVRVVDASNTSKVFFRFELTGRSAMAAGALVGDMSVSIAGLKTPFLVSAITMTLSLLLLLILFSYSRN